MRLPFFIMIYCVFCRIYAIFCDKSDIFSQYKNSYDNYTTKTFILQEYFVFFLAKTASFFHYYIYPTCGADVSRETLQDMTKSFTWNIVLKKQKSSTWNILSEVSNFSRGTFFIAVFCLFLSNVLGIPLGFCRI